MILDAKISKFKSSQTFYRQSTIKKNRYEQEGNTLSRWFQLLHETIIKKEYDPSPSSIGNGNRK